MFLSYKYRLYPHKAQALALSGTLDLCRELYNAALQERRDAWKMRRKNVRWVDQMSQLPQIKRDRPEFLEIYAQVTQNVLMRMHKTFARFFEGHKAGLKCGYPRFKPAARYNSFTFPQSGFSIVEGKLKLSKLGLIKIKLHRPIEGKIKQLTILREAGKYYAIFKCEVAAQPLPMVRRRIGIDVGLTHFATLSDGTEIKNPRYFRMMERRLRVSQRALARKNRGSGGRRKAVRNLQRIHINIKNQRNDFHHKLSRSLINEYGLIAIEDLNIKGMAAGMLSKSVADVGWGSFFNKLSYKAESAGRVLVKVDPFGTSQHCLCGNRVSKTLAQRHHKCDACGLEGKRDVISAQLIQRLGSSLVALTLDMGHGVAAEALRL